MPQIEYRIGPLSCRLHSEHWRSAFEMTQQQGPSRQLTKAVMLTSWLQRTSRQSRCNQTTSCRCRVAETCHARGGARACVLLVLVMGGIKVMNMLLDNLEISGSIDSFVTKFKQECDTPDITCDPVSMPTIEISTGLSSSRGPNM